MELAQLVFVGFNSRVVALDRATGKVVWDWKSRSGKGYTTVLLDGDRLIVSVMGYTYGMHPLTGEELWFNELAGMGSGVASLASVRGHTFHLLAAAEADATRDAAATAATSAS